MGGSFHIQNSGSGTGEVAQQVECLLCKHEDLNLSPQHTPEKLAMAMCL